MSDVAKHAAAAAAAEQFVQRGMVLSLGSGSTAAAFVRALGERFSAADLVCTATSRATAELARSVGLTVVDPDELTAIDLAVDGADEIDPEFRMIKGGGACLLWEKILARAASRMVCICDEGKLVDRLGGFPLPVEVIPFGWTLSARAVAAMLAEHGVPAEPRRRMAGAAPLRTDSANFILDCATGPIADPEALEAALNTIPGVVENGLFSREASAVVVGRRDGSVEVRMRSARLP